MREPGSDPKIIWQSQTTDHPRMSVEDVRVRAQIAHAKVRRNLVVAFVVGLLLLALCTLVIVNRLSAPVRLLTAAMMLLIVVIAYKAWYRIWRPHTLPPDAALKGCLEFYRKELQAQYRSIALTWRFLVPTVFFAFLMWNAIFTTRALVPRILLPSVLVLIFFVRRREVRKFKHKLARLDEFEKENSQ